MGSMMGTAKMSKTIKQIAVEIGVSKTAIMKQIANLGLQTSLQKNGNQFAIDERQEALILQAFQKKTQTVTQTKIENQSQTEIDTVGVLVAMLQRELDAKTRQLEEKDRQLAAKDKQIDELTTTVKTQAQSINAAQQTAQAAQALHAGTIRQQIQSSGVEPIDFETTPQKKQGIFARIFRK